MSARVAFVQPQAGLLKFGGGGGSSSIVGMQSATAGMQRLVLLAELVKRRVQRGQFVGLRRARAAGTVRCGFVCSDAILGRTQLPLLRQA